MASDLVGIISYDSAGGGEALKKKTRDGPLWGLIETYQVSQCCNMVPASGLCPGPERLMKSIKTNSVYNTTMRALGLHSYSAGTTWH